MLRLNSIKLYEIIIPSIYLNLYNRGASINSWRESGLAATVGVKGEVANEVAEVDVEFCVDAVRACAGSQIDIERHLESLRK